MDNTDSDTLQIYLLGYYVYSSYESRCGPIDMIGDIRIFYMILGYIIKQHYPEYVNVIFN